MTWLLILAAISIAWALGFSTGVIVARPVVRLPLASVLSRAERQRLDVPAVWRRQRIERGEA